MKLHRLSNKLVKSQAGFNKKAWIQGIIICLFGLVLAACGSPAVETPLVVGAETATTTAVTAGPTETPAPTATPRPRALLFAPAGADAQQVVALTELLGELAAQAGLDFESLPALAPAELDPGLRVVVALAPDPGVAGLAAAAPQTTFLAVGISGLAPAGNLLSIDPAGARADQQGFLAGYLAAVVTPDWRVGVISVVDNPSGQAHRQGFLNGVQFYCGLCRPAYPPFVQYPLAGDLTSSASEAEQIAAADALIAQGVTTIYLAPGAGSTALLEYLAGQGIHLIGSAPPPAGLAEHWIATLSADWLEAVRQAWEQALGGQLAAAPELPLAIEDVNESLLSVGRQRVVEQIRDELAAGWIDTGVNPETGEPK
jgi:hypothetical protein